MWKRGADRTCLAILHNGQALYASNAGKAADATKLNGLPPEAYIQPQGNILDNEHFEINQQTKKEYTEAGDTVDRWQMSINRGKLTVNDGYVTLTCTSETGAQYFRQAFEILFQEGDVLTLAVMLRGNGQGQLFLGDSETGANIGGGLSFTPTDDWKVYIKTIQIGSVIPKYFTLACVGQNAHFDIKRAKAEYGLYFTGWPVWNYALDLAKCQRYALEMVSAFNTKFGEIGVGSASNAIRAVIFCPVPVSLRVKPTVSFTGDFRLVESGSWQEGIPVTSITVNQVTTNGVSLYVDTAGGLSAGKWYKLAFNNSEQNSLLLNANL